MVGARRVVVPILLVLLSFPVAGVAASSSRPPSNLHRVGDHWTPYYPPDPATFPPGSRVHIIVPGDTLWDLAAEYYGNAYLWPQLWEANTYITDAHWIYPGDPLLIEGEAMRGEVMTTETTIGGGSEPFESGILDEPPGMTAQLTPGGTPIALGNLADIYCYGYLGHPDEPFMNRVASFEDVETRYSPLATTQDTGGSTDDIIFIDGGTVTGLIAGDTYLVVKRGPLVTHPRTGETIGRHYEYRGQVRILCATPDGATGVITQACSDILVGDALKPFVQIPIPISRLTAMADVCTPPNGKARGHIVNAKDFRFALGEGSLVQINLGRNDFVQPGDFLTVFRESRNPRNPPQVLGEIGVLTAEGHTATAKIVRMRYSMQVGDIVEVK